MMKEQSTAIRSLKAAWDWLVTSRMTPTALTFILGHSQPKSSGPANTYEKAQQDSLLDDENFVSFSRFFKKIFLRVFGIDGYDPLTKNLTCADGKIINNFKSDNLTWYMMLLSFIGLPFRPTTKTASGVPEYTVSHFFWNWIGGDLNPVEERITGLKVNYVIEDHRVVGKDVSDELDTLYLRRWTEKKRFLLIFSVIRVPLFFVFNLVTWPFKLLRNLIKSVTEGLLYLVSFSLAVITIFFFGFCTLLFKNMKEDGLNRSWGWQIPALILFAVISITVGLVQYAISWACRIGLAFSSPIKSALLAWNSGLEFRIGEKDSEIQIFFSYLMASLGLVFSAALSITLWSIVLPLALGALVAAVPALMLPINWVSQVPFIAKTLAWLSQFPFVMSATAAFKTALGAVGGALTSTFGSAISVLGTFVGVTIPEAVMGLVLTLSIVVMPVVSLITYGVEKLSDFFMEWVEQRPFHNFISRFESKGRSKAFEEMDEIQQVPREPSRVVVYQFDSGGPIRVQGINSVDVTDKICGYVATYHEANKIVDRAVSTVVLYDREQFMPIYNRAIANSPKLYGSSTQKTVLVLPLEAGRDVTFVESKPKFD